MEFTKDINFNNNPTANDCLAISYNGFLCNSEEVFIVYGFGQNWEHTSEVKMRKTPDGFFAEIDMLNFDTFNFCFRNSYNEWDNNYNCNYISQIAPCVIQTEKVDALFNELLSVNETSNIFDIDALIEQILDPTIPEKFDNTPVQINSVPIDLGVEITKILSQISVDAPTQELKEYSSLDEILSCKVIHESSVDLGEIKEESSLIPLQTENSFTISSRQLSKFYLFKKRIKLALYKAFIKIPKMIFGTDE